MHRLLNLLVHVCMPNVLVCRSHSVQMAQDQLQTVRHQNKTLQEDLSRAEGEAARHAVAAAEAKAAAAAALKPRPEDGAATAALQQALQQLSLRTAEVVELKKRLDGAAAAGSSASTAAGGEAAEGLRSAGSSGPATPVVAAAGEGVATIVAHAALSADGGSTPASPSAAAVAQAAAAADGTVEASSPADVAASSPRAVAAQASEAAPGSSGGNELAGAPHALDSSEEAAAAGDAPSIAEPAAEAVATPAAAAVGEVVTAAADGTVANGPSPAAAAAAGDLPQDLQAAHQQIVELQQRVAQLQQELAAAAAGHSDEEEESDEEHHCEYGSGFVWCLCMLASHALVCSTPRQQRKQRDADVQLAQPARFTALSLPLWPRPCRSHAPRPSLAQRRCTSNSAFACGGGGRGAAA